MEPENRNPDVRSIDAPVGNPSSSPARPAGLEGLRSHQEVPPGLPGAGHAPRWLAFWKHNFCIRENTSYGSFDGVFPTCFAHLMNVIVFLRTGWIVAKSGVLLSISISLLCVAFAGVTVLSAIGILRRSSVECRDVYHILSVTLGTQAAGSVGLIYAFTHVLGMGELIVGLYFNDGDNHDWPVRGVACGFLLLLALLNAFGIKWIIRTQYVIVVLLALGIGDFAIGTFFRKDPEYGIEGPSGAVLRENLYPQYASWHDYFTSLGIFFPSTVGALVGFNIASDLRDPHRNIPRGTFAALFCSFWVHLVFILLLGLSVLRSFLADHPHNAVRMAAVQVFIVVAIFVSSFASGMGGLFNASRVLSHVAKDTSIRGVRNLDWKWQRYNTPILSVGLIFALSLGFVLIGRINFLAPIITTSHFMIFATINYAYFALSTTYKLQVNREQQATTEWLQQGLREGRIASPESRSPKVRSPETYPTMSHSSSVTSERSHLLGSGSLNTTPKEPMIPMTIASPVLSKPVDWYLKLHNRWAALISGTLMVVFAFIIQWESALSAVSSLGLIYILICYLIPKGAPGIVEFHPIDWLSAKLNGGTHETLKEDINEAQSVSVPEDPYIAGRAISQDPASESSPFVPR